MDPRDRDDVVHRALRALAPPAAPPTLLPRVMAAARERQVRAAAPVARPWLSWPLWAQAASAAALIVVMAAILWAWPAVWNTSAGSAADAWRWIEPRLTPLVAAMWGTARALLILWDAVLRPLASYVLVWMTLMLTACAVFGAALGRVALGGVSQS